MRSEQEIAALLARYEQDMVSALEREERYSHAPYADHVKASNAASEHGAIETAAQTLRWVLGLKIDADFRHLFPEPSKWLCSLWGFLYLRPMRKIMFYGWEVGMRKVSFSRLLMDKGGLCLKEAHESTIRILDEQPVTLQVSDELAERLMAQAKVLGVKCRLEPPPATS